MHPQVTREAASAAQHTSKQRTPNPNVPFRTARSDNGDRPGSYGDVGSGPPIIRGLVTLQIPPSLARTAPVDELLYMCLVPVPDPDPSDVLDATLAPAPRSALVSGLFSTRRIRRVRTRGGARNAGSRFSIVTLRQPRWHTL